MAPSARSHGTGHGWPDAVPRAPQPGRSRRPHRCSRASSLSLGRPLGVVELLSPERVETSEREINAIDPDVYRRYQEDVGVAQATKHVDMSWVRDRDWRSEERRLMPEYVERFFGRACDQVAVRLEQRADGLWRIENVPQTVRAVGTGFGSAQAGAGRGVDRYGGEAASAAQALRAARGCGRGDDTKGAYRFPAKRREP